MANKIKCDECKYGIDVNESGLVKMCDAPKGHKMYKTNPPSKHGHRFSCGYGVMWNEKEADDE